MIMLFIIDDVVKFRFGGAEKNSIPSQHWEIDKLTFDVAIQLCENAYPFIFYIYYISFIIYYQRRICSLVCSRLFVTGIKNLELKPKL